jgi:hypothetical protein
MSALIVISEKILVILNQLSDERRKILFGNSAVFSNWLKENGMNKKVKHFKM